MRTSYLLLLAFLAWRPGQSAPSPSPSQSASSPAVVAALDQKKIHADYNDGNFEKVTNALEAFMSSHKTYSLQDSVFIAKHLAVVYTANPDTREKGKYYMYRLLALLPSARLVDMYVSDEIDRIFDKVREEFLARQQNFGVDAARMALPQDPPATSRANDRTAAASTEPRKDGHVGFWIAGGAAAVAAGLTTAYFIIENQPAPAPDKIYRVPN
ncbi:MAG: hypothetical protein JF616_03680 [Fibrobacteres bacterium]|nr:hypothetical protein [Fibrobacterota bacterium]